MYPHIQTSFSNRHSLPVGACANDARTGQARKSRLVKPGSFAAQHHFYPQALDARLHPVVEDFLVLDASAITRRYVLRHPDVDARTLEGLLGYFPRYFRWAGADLFPVTNGNGEREIVVIEINSCPSGQKAMPSSSAADPYRSYRRLVEETFILGLADSELPSGGLAVIYDKNPMEVSGYAATIADLLDEPVHMVEYPAEANSGRLYFDRGVMHVHTEAAGWTPIRAAFRYVTQRPWDRIPIRTRTAVLNPVVSCLAGGRNKLMAYKAYEALNNRLKGSGLRLRTPRTVCDVVKAGIPACVEQFGGHAVVKVPYSNAGQGVYTITNPRELQQFMAQEFQYECFVVQELVGHQNWNPSGVCTRRTHLPIVPPGRNEPFVADLRMMVGAGAEGFRPVALYARRAPEPISDTLSPDRRSHPMLCTNLSYRRADGRWDTDPGRLLLADRSSYPALNLTLDDLVEAFVQTVLGAVAVDEMATTLMDYAPGRFRTGLASFNRDDALLAEILTH